jgi:hypothetical protein
MWVVIVSPGHLFIWQEKGTEAILRAGEEGQRELQFWEEAEWEDVEVVARKGHK